MAFDPRVERATRALAKKNSTEEALLLAVVEIECAGAAFESDGVTPRFLFERHKFYSFLAKKEPELLNDAVAQGLAHPDFRRISQYKDQGTSKGRMLLLERAKGISMEGAYSSCSWGIGQIMGFNAASLGYGTATQMFSELRAGGIHAQVECMWRFMKTKNLLSALKRKDWVAFAKGYNGPAYAQNDYDTRLANAYAKWSAKLIGVDPEEEEDIPLGRTPVQNAEPSTVWKTPEGVATTVTAGTGVAAALKPESKDGRGPMDFAFAFVIIIGVVVGAYYFVRRLRRNPE